jgi:crotonobetainyl-CoA:carnitine CoA-transferase CaiB-like acyl-CoA transferase
MGFLSPYKVLDLTDERGLIAGSLFAGLGADVVHLEPLDGSTARNHGPFIGTGESARSLLWDSYTVNQRSVACDLDTRAGRELALMLAAEADFVLDSSKPALSEARSLTYQVFREVNPGVIYVSITPFGGYGPKAGYADTDLVLWAAGGPLFPHRDGDQPPVRISVPQAYVNAGADAVGGALIALWHRAATGEGQQVSVSVQVSVAQATVGKILAGAVGDRVGGAWASAASEPLKKEDVPVRVDQSGSGSSTGRSKWPVLDGFVEMHLAMGPPGGRTNNLWNWLIDSGADGGLKVLDWREVPTLIQTGAMTMADLEPYREQVGAFFATKTKREIQNASVERTFLAATISSIEDIARSEQHASHDYWMTVGAGTDRELTVPGAYARSSEDAFDPRRNPAPEVGEHTAEVLGEWLGLGESEIDELTSERILR